MTGDLARLLFIVATAIFIILAVLDRSLLDVGLACVAGGFALAR